AELLTHTKFATLNQNLEIYSKHLSIVTQVEETLDKHPWAGLTNYKLTFAVTNELLTTLSKLRNSAQLLDDSIESLNNRVGSNVAKTPQSLREFLQIKLLLPDVSQEVIRELVPRLVNLSDRETISSFCERFYIYKNLYGSLDYYFESIPQLEASQLI